METYLKKYLIKILKKKKLLKNIHEKFILSHNHHFSIIIVHSLLRDSNNPLFIYIKSKLRFNEEIEPREIFNGRKPRRRNDRRDNKRGKSGLVAKFIVGEKLYCGR